MVPGSGRLRTAVRKAELSKPCLAQEATFTGGLLAYPATRKMISFSIHRTITTHFLGC